MTDSQAFQANRCTVRRNQPNLKPWEQAPAVAHFLSYSEASAWLSAHPDREQLHITVD